MALTDDQQELLHAWMEGETTVAEDRVVEQLLRHEGTRNEAREYLNELKCLRDVARSQSPVPLPPGLREKVLVALRNESLPGATDSLTRYPWRTMIVAAAAVTVVVLGLMFGPAVFEQPAAAGNRMAGIGDGSGPPEIAGAIDAQPAPQVQGGEASGPHRMPVSHRDDGRTEFDISMICDDSVSAVGACNDLLIVGSLYGDADLIDPPPHGPGESSPGLGDVVVELVRKRLHTLVAAVESLVANQHYGQLVIPDEMRREVERNHETFARLQSLSAELSNPDTPDGEAPLRCYLPPEMQRRDLARQSEDAGQPDVMRDGLHTLADSPGAREGDSAGQVEPHKVKLFIHLR